MRIMVTGGAGFIGSAVVRYLINEVKACVLTFDKLTYAGNLNNLNPVMQNQRHLFVQGDICDQAKVTQTFDDFKPDIIMHLAAESHVDRSIDGAKAFIETNIVGTFTLLEAARRYWLSLKSDAKSQFRFLHVSTDEVFGTLGNMGFFNENSAYDPSSPYSASKASADHLAKAWHRTYGLPVIVSNCSNNYGPYHFPEKLIPLSILNALEGKPISVYGNGQNIRDWLYVDDHARALYLIAQKGQIGETYTVGGRNEATNLNVVQRICDLMDRLKPKAHSHSDLITYVTDRPGHDYRYAIDASRLEGELGWRASETFETGLEKTVQWYLDNETWWRPLRDKIYDGTRLGK